MQKNVPTLIGIIIIVVATILIFGGVFTYQYFAVKQNNQLQILNEEKNKADRKITPVVVKDKYGCISSDGYSWCEAKQKCLRSWEEKCEEDRVLSFILDEATGQKIYRNEKYGFEVKLPKSFAKLFENKNIANFGIGVAGEIFEVYANNNQEHIISRISVAPINLFKFTNTGASEIIYDKEKNTCLDKSDNRFLKTEKYGFEGCYITEGDIGGGYSGYIIPDLKNNQVIIITVNFSTPELPKENQEYFNYENSKIILDQMLSTFKFINKISDNSIACKKEGESIPVIPNPPVCCSGLIPLKPKYQDLLGSSGVCTVKCGNGICDSENESNYNCPQDCIEKSSVTIISPNGGEKLVRGQQFNVTWKTSGAKDSDSINFFLCNEGMCTYIKDYKISNLSGISSSYLWTLSNDATIGEKYKILIKIYREGGLLTEDKSDNYFTITK